MERCHTMTRAKTSHLLFGVLAMALLGTLPSTANASIEAPKRAQAQSTQGRVFVQEHAKRFRGTLLAGYGGYYLRRVPTKKLEEDLDRIHYSLHKYTRLNAPHTPSIAGPILLMAAGGLGVVVGFLAIIPYTFTGSLLVPGIILAAGGAVLIPGLIWLVINIARRRRTPYYKKLRRLKILRKAILIELHNRTDRRYGLRLPPVQGQQLAFSF